MGGFSYLLEFSLAENLFERMDFLLLHDQMLH